jgi:5-methylcytosine-specific restriction endonuclease McrA
LSGAWGAGSTRAWRKTREQVLRRDGYRCMLQIEGVCVGRADCVHHTIGKANGDDPDHLVAACTPCNLRVGDPGAKDPAWTPKTSW